MIYHCAKVLLQPGFPFSSEHCKPLDNSLDLEPTSAWMTVRSSCRAGKSFEREMFDTLRSKVAGNTTGSGASRDASRVC